MAVGYSYSWGIYQNGFHGEKKSIKLLPSVMELKMLNAKQPVWLTFIRRPSPKAIAIA